MEELLQRLSSLSAREYGLLELLVKAGLIERAELIRLVQQVVDDRLDLAQVYLEHAQACDLARDSECRQVISRAYYTCHHAGRAVVYDVQRRDVTTHEGVMTGIGQILGQDTARAVRGLHRLRNQVEYELYLLRLDLRVEAEAALIQASEFLNDCRAFIAARR